VVTSRRARAADFARTLHITLTLALIVGVVTGLAVAGFERCVGPLLDRLLEQPLWVIALVPAFGFIAVSVINRWCGDRDTATTDAYIRAYHERGGQLGVRTMVRTVLLSIISLGSGSALGFEGPSLLIGSTVGSTFERRFAGRIRRDDAKVLMVAGAAAGVAAIFKAPLTGVCFALEVPYRGDLARRALPATLAAAGSAYLTYVTIVGTEPLFTTGGAAPFDVRDLVGGVALGVACGVLARAGAWAIGRAKRLAIPLTPRLAGAVVAVIGLALVSNWWFELPLHLGPSYQAIEWVTSADRSVALLVGLFCVRAASTWVSIAGGGVGGLFIPLVTQGVIVGALVQHLAPAANPALFPTVGIAAFLGAGYRTPLAGVAFVAEATGQPGFLVPALLAAAAAQVVMGRWSFSPYQRQERVLDLTPLTRMTLLDVMTPNPDTVDATGTVADVLPQMLRQTRRWAPAVDGDGAYVGLLAIADIGALPESDWATTPIADVLRAEVPAASSSDSIQHAAATMRASGNDAVAVVNDDEVVGVVTLRDVTNVEVLLDRLAADMPDP
jgi:chloride channel protein, CIC family